MFTLETKQDLYTRICTTLQKRINGLKEQIEDLQQASGEETKSSAGDKFETSREMLRQEKDNLLLQLAEQLKQKAILDQMVLVEDQSKIQLGSLLSCSMGNFFLAISQGKVQIEGKSFFVISLNSPIAKAMQQAQDKTFSFRGKQITIEQLL